jgi:hypothetical protein
MAEVVSLSTARPQLIWVCNCNCSTFYLCGDGEARCSSCDKVVCGDATDRGWWDRVKHGPDAGPEPPHADTDGIADFGEAHAKRMAASPETAWLIRGTEGGGVSVWARVDLSDAAQADWLAGRIAVGTDMMLRKGAKP